MPPPPAKRVLVLGLPAPSATLAVVRESRKRPSANPDATKRKRCTKAGPLPTKVSGLGLSSRHRAKFVSLIDGMISECGLEVERLAKEFEEFRENELERDLGKTASSLLKVKEVKASKSSELRRLKRKVKSGEGSLVCAIGEAKEAMRAEFQARLARIVDSFASLMTIHVRDLALAGVEGGTNAVGEAPLFPRPEGATLPIRRVELVDAEGDFDQILAGLKSECILPSCSGEPEGQDPVSEV
ncbi:hypothetical protein F2Q69_00006392 [Brassica cretica]|uniref:Uncharacterized protein n=1 Tax=Brassica cretica TaxID=69181 RepID=A0A8S9NWK5_BRACR|nr:hypothetical protein F2Q69_00006392 [Brassica cretica]